MTRLQPIALASAAETPTRPKSITAHVNRDPFLCVSSNPKRLIRRSRPNLMITRSSPERFRSSIPSMLA
jgi:hypothetical protein